MCEKHDGQMYLYVHKWEFLKVYFKVIKFEVIRFLRLQSLHLFLRAGDLDRGQGEGLWGVVGVDI